MPPNQKYFRCQREPKICTGRDFPSWITKQRISDEEKRQALEQWRLHSKKLPLAAETEEVPMQYLNLYQIKKLIKWLEDWFEELKATPYEVEFINETSYTFSDVVWSYRLRNGIVTVEAKWGIAPGQTAHFSYPSCFDMYDYAFAIYIDDEEVLRSETMTVGEVNDLENQAYGQINMCADVWHIKEE